MILSIIILSCGCFYQGESAYEIAVKNGFTGTEAEWLESLKGEQGEKGEDGANGLNGINGKDGKDGENFHLDYTATDLYNEAVNNGYTGTFNEFISDFFGANTVNLNSAINIGLLSSCNILCPYTVEGTSSSGTPTTNEFSSGGAGVFYSVDKEKGDAIIITNYHVVYREGSSNANKINEEINVYLYGDTYFLKPIQAEYVGGTANYDIAVLRITNSELIKKSTIFSVDFLDSDLLSIGDTIIAVGNPSSEGSSVNCGMVNVPSENISTEDVLGNSVTNRVIRFDAVVNPGNSGGGLFTDEGKLCGIVYARMNKANFYGINYAIPSNLVKALVENIIDYCYNATDGNENVYKVKMGMEIKVTDTVSTYDEIEDIITTVEEITVSNVDANSLSSLYFKKGDILNSITYAGKTYEIDRLHTFSEFLYNIRFGHQFTVNITRSFLTYDVTIKVDNLGYMTKVA